MLQTGLERGCDAAFWHERSGTEPPLCDLHGVTYFEVVSILCSCSVEEHDADGFIETELYLPETFHMQESAIEAAIQAGRQKIDMGFERGSAVVNG